MTSELLLDGLRFKAFHGVGEQERVVGHDFSVTLKVACDLEQAIATDDINHAVSYADIYAIVKCEMEVPSRLLEHVAGRIMRAIHERFPQVKAVDITIMKRNPPIGADAQGFGVHICQKY